MYTEFEHKAIDRERRHDALSLDDGRGRRRIATTPVRRRGTRRIAHRIAGALDRLGGWALNQAQRIRGDDPAQETYTRVGVSPIR